MATDVIDADGVYTDREGNRFQFKKGHVLPPGAKAGLSRAGDFPAARGQGEEELEATKADPAPENKMAPGPTTKTDGRK